MKNNRMAQDNEDTLKKRCCMVRAPVRTEEVTSATIPLPRKSVRKT